MDKNLLISKMKLFVDRYVDLAQYLGISVSRFSAKINETNGAEFNQGEIKNIKGRYNLSNDEVNQIFLQTLYLIKIQTKKANPQRYTQMSRKE